MMMISRVSQRMALYKDCQESLYKNGTFNRIEDECKIHCDWKDEPHNLALMANECSVVFFLLIYRHFMENLEMFN